MCCFRPYGRTFFGLNIWLFWSSKKYKGLFTHKQLQPCVALINEGCCTENVLQPIKVSPKNMLLTNCHLKCQKDHQALMTMIHAKMLIKIHQHLVQGLGLLLSFNVFIHLIGILVWKNLHYYWSTLGQVALHNHLFSSAFRMCFIELFLDWISLRSPFHLDFSMGYNIKYLPGSSLSFRVLLGNGY